MDSPADRSVTELIEDLRTHQVELEMQNLQLRDAQLQLEASRQKYFALFDLAPVAYLILDEQRSVDEINLVGAHLLGKDRAELLHRPLAPHLTDESRPLFHRHMDQVLASASAQGTEIRLNNARSNRIAHVLLSSSRLEGFPPRVLMAAFDVTAERQAQSQQQAMEQQLRSAQKMESLGRMAGGMAHDFNNLLQAIAGFTDLAMGDTDLDLIRESLVQIRQTAQRASRLTQQILAFSRRHPAQPQAVQLGDLLLELSPLLERLLRPGVRLSIRPAGALPATWVDKGQMEQVITNLVLNAVDAMPDGGEIELVTRYVPDALSTGQALSDAVMLEVTDSGKGLSDEVLEHLFEPFFTTKPKGRGTGLGLSVVHGIVARHGGRVQAENCSPHGARFSVLLPLARLTKHPTEAAPNLPAEDGHGECVLVVEDEQVLRDLSARMLKGHGYLVITACDGQDAVEKYRQHTGVPISLILMDVMMPRLGGVEAYEQINALGAQCPPVLFVSGYVGDADLPVALDGQRQFLAKPFGERELLQAISRCLSKV